jgi:hypothetical protein
MIFKVKKIKVNSLGAQLSREFVEPPICDTICLAPLLKAPAATLDRIPKICAGRSRPSHTVAG